MVSKETKPWKELVLLRLQGADGNEHASLLASQTGNSYWEQRIRRTLEHSDEPEIWYVLQRFANKNTVFIDGGANIGLWSSVAASIIGDPSQVIAVDPSHDTLDQLKQNALLNNNSFTIVDKALSNESNLSLPFNEYGREANMLNSLHDMTSKWTPSVRNVTTVTVDDLVAPVLERQGRAISNVIIKLDIEKSEYEALQGSLETLHKQNALVIYEDHREEDPRAELTGKVLGMGMHVYHVDSNWHVKRIEHQDELQDIRVGKRRGYNFLACMPGSDFDRELGELCGKDLRPAIEPLQQRR